LALADAHALSTALRRSRNTQVTVNNQIVMGTLMNLADHPTRCSVGESWREDKTLRRVPIIITGNDLSTLYAPLLRDGRMTKFLWEPEREDLLEMMYTLYRDDGLSLSDVEQLLDAFPAQSALAACLAASPLSTSLTRPSQAWISSARCALGSTTRSSAPGRRTWARLS
jgi:hypothetical protein